MQNHANPLLEKCNNKKKDRTKMLAMFFKYIQTCIYIFTTLLIAELLRRIYKYIIEYRDYGQTYLPDQRALQIFKRVFSLTTTTQLTLLAFLLIILLETAVQRKFPLVPATYLLYMPLYWIYHATQLSHTNLDYADFIRSRHGMDYGEGMASSFFHGYINLTMPSHNGDLGMRERIELFAAERKVKFAINRLVILIPNKLYVAPKIESRILEKNAPLQTVRKNRAGVDRPFQNDVYRFNETINGEFFYIALEGATPLLTFFEAGRSDVTSTWQMKEFEREILLKFYKSLKRIISESPQTRNEVELIFYDEKKPDGSPEDVGEYLKSYFEKQWAEKPNKID